MTTRTKTLTDRLSPAQLGKMVSLSGRSIVKCCDIPSWEEAYLRSHIVGRRNRRIVLADALAWAKRHGLPLEQLEEYKRNL